MPRNGSTTAPSGCAWLPSGICAPCAIGSIWRRCSCARICLPPTSAAARRGWPTPMPAIEAKRDALDNYAGRLATHSERHESLLARGYVVVRDGAMRVLTEARAIKPGEGLDLEFYDGRVGAIAGRTPRRPVRRSPPRPEQGSLF